MNNQIFFWMNKFFEWIFLLYYWMNFWMNQKSAIFIRKMNKKCVLSKKRPILHVFFTVFHCISLFCQALIFFQFEWIILLNEYSWFNFELNIELNHFLARFNVKMNNQNLSPSPISRRSPVLPYEILAALFGCHEISFWGNLVPGNHLVVHFLKYYTNLNGGWHW